MNRHYTTSIQKKITMPPLQRKIMPALNCFDFNDKVSSGFEPYAEIIELLSDRETLVTVIPRLVNHQFVVEVSVSTPDGTLDRLCKLYDKIENFSIKDLLLMQVDDKRSEFLDESLGDLPKKLWDKHKDLSSNIKVKVNVGNSIYYHDNNDSFICVECNSTVVIITNNVKNEVIKLFEYIFESEGCKVVILNSNNNICKELLEFKLAKIDEKKVSDAIELIQSQWINYLKPSANLQLMSRVEIIDLLNSLSGRIFSEFRQEAIIYSNLVYLKYKSVIQDNFDARLYLNFDNLQIRKLVMLQARASRRAAK